MKTLKKRSEWRKMRQFLLAGMIAAVLLLTALSESGAVAAAGMISSELVKPNPTFSDVKEGQWFKSFVSELATMGIVRGYPDGTFRPSAQVTVGQFLSMVIQTGQRNGVLEERTVFDQEGLQETDPDTEKTHWARSFYNAALENGLLFSDELPKTSLDRPISRQWMAVIAVRLMTMTESEGMLEPHQEAVNRGEEFEAVLDSIQDVEEMTPYSYEIVRAYQKGLLSGYPDGSFRPEGYLTRAEAAVVIHKLNGWKTDQVSDAATEPTVEPVDEPVCGYEENPSDMAKGTKLFWCRIGENHGGVKTLMERWTPELAENLYENFCGFSNRAGLDENRGKQGLRKEYVSGYPVLMEAVGGEIHVYVKPKGSETRFWGVSPGQVSEEFF